MRCTGNWIFFEALVHPMECKDEECPKKVTEDFERELRGTFEMHYIRFNRELVRFVSEGSVYAKHVWVLWQNLAKVLGCTEAGLRQKWLDEGQCWNAACRTRMETAKGRHRRCARCHKVRFCSSECQKE
ncbi:uncharacterized protein PHACADRAFT_255664 [Phanerochaete carnosa HHB-10118-sp]|uniref:MYND-type domain-containing protein n=1 Tax=Phanerochaete carnosa (strain HHB-10118-sp) TaxID=650164 RepID=K5UYI6_PHACS|nr:uncharacterized protein PHACADRAFT_255664 [Phanerochaete carnosa HHB-10118-sp]EKM55211.1 hypothetical protein PHACADRAFT_255664 [Phanerochaete carnosa HHB-10118-sp]